MSDRSPIEAKMGKAFSYAFVSPPTMIVRVPSAALSVPPLMGASKNVPLLLRRLLHTFWKCLFRQYCDPLRSGQVGRIR
ncbi:MAG: hypothetical protein CM1200mP35_09430 [Chloroflexota bacterium]|nr:MAG: hypothetical protein CM1200mP35_09430 [Chloroflexota bacterium]